jgi:hypothetical protein
LWRGGSGMLGERGGGTEEEQGEAREGLLHWVDSFCRDELIIYLWVPSLRLVLS